jgi:hypothetical protein
MRKRTWHYIWCERGGSTKERKTWLAGWLSADKSVKRGGSVCAVCGRLLAVFEPASWSVEAR